MFYYIKLFKEVKFINLRKEGIMYIYLVNEVLVEEIGYFFDVCKYNYK